MKTQIVTILIFALLVGCSNPEKVSNQRVLNELQQLAKTEDFFKLKKAYTLKKEQLSDAHSIYFVALINKVFNKPAASNDAINQLLAMNDTDLTNKMLNTLYGAKLLNHINLYEYDDAAKTSRYIQENYQNLNDSSEMETLQNEIKIWQALSGVPKQEVLKTSDCIVPMYKDKVGLFNVDVEMGGSTINFLFDTGANFSFIVKSLVEEYGLTYFEADFYVTAATGAKVKSGVAVADELSFGGITFKNVVFLVMNDEDFSFPQFDFYPNGAIGFPVIEALDEIRINKENEIFVPQKPVEYAYDNFALNGLMPVIAGIHNGDTLRFNFDTGASNTMLYPLFYSDYKQEIEEKYEKETFKSGGGGGTVEFEGYVINDFNLSIADSEATLNKIRLHSDTFGDEELHNHGNFGQDYISQFDEMIISFKYSSVLFK